MWSGRRHFLDFQFFLLFEKGFLHACFVVRIRWVIYPLKALVDRDLVFFFFFSPGRKGWWSWRVVLDSECWCSSVFISVQELREGWLLGFDDGGVLLKLFRIPLLVSELRAVMISG